MRLLYLESTLLPPVSWPLVCLISSSPPGHFQPAPPLLLSLSYFFFHQLRCKMICIQLQCSLLFSLSTLLPLGTVCIPSLHHICQLSSLPVIVPIFKVPTFMSEHLPSHTSRCLLTRLPHLFLLLFSLCLAVA